MAQNITSKNSELEGVKLELVQKNSEINNLKIKIQEFEKYKNFNNNSHWNNNQLIQPYNQLNQNNQISFVGCDSLNLDENLIAINVTSGDSHINFSVVCKDNTQFVDVERKIYEKYPEYLANDGLDNLFLGNGRRINRFQTMAQNGFPGYCITLARNNFGY